MNKLIVACVALSFALLACSDESSPVASGSQISGGGVSSVTVLESSSAVTNSVSSVAAPKSSATVPASSVTVPASSAAAAPKSSATVPASSAVFASSSSVTSTADSLSPLTDESRLVIRNAVGQCGTLQNLEASQDAGFRAAEKPDMLAFRSVSSDSTEFLIRNVQLTCGWVLDSLEITTSGDTLVVDAAFDRSNAQRCLCDYQFLFKVKSDSIYSNPNFVTLRTGPVRENDHTTQILDSEIWGSDPVSHVQVISNVSAKCNKNEVAENVPRRVASTIEVNLVDTTSSGNNKPHATMKILDNGFIRIDVDGVYLPCGVIIESVSVSSTGGSTIFASIKVDPSSPVVNCICPTRISFDVKNENGFANANYISSDEFGQIQILKTKE
ncbi:MAG: hypothetical protein IKS97_06895 [Fibrobacter sp.]|nr:hypothetical protein [Fibrobacter sp.]